MTPPTDRTGQPDRWNNPRLADVPVRDALAQVPAYQPGRPPTARPGQRTYKMSSNENPYPPLPSVLSVVDRAATAMNRYPDMFCGELTRAIATDLDVAPTDVVVGTGSSGVLSQLMTATCQAGDSVVYAWRSFEAYPIMVALSGARSVQVSLTAQAGHDLPAMADAIDGTTRVVLVCSPNNPTGPVVTQREMDAFMDGVPSNVLVAIDEAYLEFNRDPAAVDGLATYRARANVMVLRTFSKAYGLAGLRVGYGVAAAPVAEALRKCAVPFGVSHVAQQAALASLKERAELLQRVDALVAARDAVHGALLDQGWQIPVTQANFVWLPLGDRSAEFATMADEAGLSVRAFPGEGVRASVDVPEGNALLVEVAGRFLRDHG